MTVQNMWPLVFLCFIPVIILLYILKQKAKDISFSSVMLWQEIYKNLEAKTPFEKLKHNILMYLQIILMLLLIFSLMAPSLKNGGKSEENLVLVLDTSASMKYLYDDNHSRLEEAVARARKEMDQVFEQTTVTLITVDEEARIVYQGKDKITLKKRLNELKAANKSGNLDVASDVVNSVVSGMNQAYVKAYTDSNFQEENWIYSNENTAYEIESLYSEGENVAVSYINYSIEDNTMQALCKVENYSDREITTDVSLYVGNQITDVQTISIPAGEGETVYFKEQSVPVDQGVIAKAEISSKDSLLADNTQSVEIVSNQQKNILLLSKGNVFLEKALTLDENAEVYKAEAVNVLEQNEQPFDLYVFDGVDIPENFKLAKEMKACIFMNYEGLAFSPELIKKKDAVSNQMLHFIDTPITEYVDGFSFGVSNSYLYELPNWANSMIATKDGNSCGYYGEMDGCRVGVIGFDIHSTDLALQTEYPLFMSQLTDYLLRVSESTVAIDNFPIAESNVDPAENSQIQGKEELAKTGGRAIRNWLLILVLVLLLVEWIIYVKQVRTSKKIQFLCYRCLLMLMVVLAMAGLSISKKQDIRETIFLVDVSDSVSGNLTNVEEYVKKMIQEMPDKNRAGVIAFGKDTAVDQFVSEKKLFSSIQVAPVTTATNIEKAVQSACSMFNEGASKQLVLITDGSENEGNMSIAAAALKANDVALSTICLEESISSQKEVYVDQLDIPDVVHVGDRYNVTVSIMSNVETPATITLYAGRSIKGTQEVRLNKGENKFLFEDEGVEGSIANYKVVVDATEDTIKENNTYVAFSQIEAQPKVLLVEGRSDEAKEFEKVLGASNIGYDRVTAKSVPVSVSELNQYKAVILVNVHYDDLRTGFDQSITSYVKEFAGGLICIGGDNSYALGNYRGTVLEDILPVNMELRGEREIPKMAMAMVIDHSGSMTMPAKDNTSITGLDLAKQAALLAVDQFRDKDEIAVVAFDDSYQWTIPFRLADNKSEIKSKIQSIAPGGGTSIYPALAAAYDQIVKSDAEIKHIILLTDGQDGYGDYSPIVNSVKQSGVTISCVAVGTDADQGLLRSLAERCDGRFYYTDIDNSIPRIFAQEVYLSSKAYLVNEPFYPTITSNNAILDGVFDEGAPMLLGYVAATPKQTADVFLTSDSNDPILSTWQYGLGRTVAWNSDGTNEWTAECANWEHYPKLWSNIIHSVIANTDLNGDSLEVEKEGNSARIHYETEEYDQTTKINAVITDEEGNPSEVVLDAIKPGVYETVIPADQVGVYNISIRKNQGDELIANYNTAYAKQYSLEYQFADGNSDLMSFTNQANGTVLTFEDSVWKREMETVKGRVSLATFFIILAIVLWMIDIAIRRLAIDVAGYMRSFVKGKQELRAKGKEEKARKRREVMQSNTEATDSIESNEASSKMGEASSHKAVQGTEAKKSSENKASNAEATHADAKNIKSSEKPSNKRKEGKENKASSNNADNAVLDMNQLLKKKKDRE